MKVLQMHMKKTIEQQEKIRIPVLFFAMFVALMLYQTSGTSMGTVLAFFSIIGTVITALLSGMMNINRFYLSNESILLLLFLTITTISSLFLGPLPGYYARFAAQIVLFLTVVNIRVNEREKRFLENVFISASVIYAILTIYSCVSMGDSRYYHGDIVLFDTAFDPNYIGIPFVATAALLLNRILRERKRVLSVCLYTVILIAIVYTASRGNFIALLLSNALVLLLYVFERNRRINSFWKKALIVAGVFLLSAVLIQSLSTVFDQQWQRMTLVDNASDNGRLHLWNQAFASWQERPLLGNGLQGMYRIYGKATHNTFLQVLSETGIVGFILYLAFIVGMIIKSYKNSKVYFCLVLGMLVQMTFLDALDNRCVWAVLCWMILLSLKKGSDPVDNKVHSV